MTPLLAQADLARVVDQHEQNSEELAVMERWIEGLAGEQDAERRATMKRIVAFLESYAVRHAHWEESAVMPALPRETAVALCNEHQVIEAGVRGLGSIASAGEPDVHLFASRALKLIGALEAHFIVEERALRSLPSAPSSKTLGQPLGHLPADISAAAILCGTVADCMTTDVIVAKPADVANDVAALMAKNDISCVPVVDDEGAVVGIMLRDLIFSLDRRRSLSRSMADSFDPTYPTELSPRATTAEVMVTPSIVLRSDDTIARAALRMTELRAHVAPVVNERGALVGVLSALDILRLVARSAPLEEKRRRPTTEEEEEEAAAGAPS